MYLLESNNNWEYSNYTSFKNKLFEGGNAFDNVRPLTQKESVETYDIIKKDLFPKLGLDGDGIDALPIGSFGKKLDTQTSGDIDIAVSIDKIASINRLGVNDVLDWLGDTLKKLKYDTKVMKGFQQVSIAFPINGNVKNGYAQVDLMLSSNMDWSKFVYTSPNFKLAESKYKGLYRNMLLMSILSEAMKKVTKTNKDEIEEYEMYAMRMDSGIFKVKKSFMGKKGNLVKTAVLLKDQDEFITNTPEELIEICFGPGFGIPDMIGFENVWKLVNSSTFPHKAKLKQIIDKFKYYVEDAKVPLPTEIT